MKYTFLFLLIFAPTIVLAQPSIRWQKCLGGTKHDQPGGLLQTRDGGYIMAGSSVSSDGDLTSNHGNYDLWIVKMDAEGKIQWQKTYGGSHEESGGSIIESIDGGYIIASSTHSIDGDLTGISTRDSTSDIWLLKIDSLGNIKWQKTFGGAKEDYAWSIVKGGEGEYIVSAVTTSSDGDVKGFHGGSGYDIWVFSISEKGDLGWQKIFGGTQEDNGGIIEIPGGYAIIGSTYSNDGDVTGRTRATSAEVWLIKLNIAGDIIWQKTYGGSNYDAANSGIQTLDHGYIITGITTSKDGDVSGIHSSPANFSDCWVLKLDSTGKIEWQKCLGGSNGEIGYSIFQTSDSGYIVSASTASGDGDVIGFHGNTDCWVFKLSKKGDLIWQKTLGGSASTGASSSGIMPTADSGFLLETMTSSNDGDVHGLHGDSDDIDIWLVKLSQDPSGVKNITEMKAGSISAYPNPSTGKTTVYYDLDKRTEVKIELFNPLGEKLRTLLNMKEESGIHEHSFDLSDLPSGSYFFRIESDGVSVLKAVELIR